MQSWYIIYRNLHCTSCSSTKLFILDKRYLRKICIMLAAIMQ